MAVIQSSPSSEQTSPGAPPSQDGPALSESALAPPKSDNRSRFESFIDRINRREWELLGESVQPSLSYNRQDLSRSDFIQLVKQEFSQQNTTISIVTTVGGDTNTDTNGPVAARLRVQTPPTEQPHPPSSTTPPYARHMFALFHNTKISHLYDMSDHTQNQTQDQTPPTPTPPPIPNLHPNPQITTPLPALYTAYLACVNGPRMAQDLHRFLHPAGVVVNGARLTVPQYADMVTGVQGALAGLVFALRTLVADERRGVVAARIELGGRLAPVGGVGDDGDEGGLGEEVVFGEIVFYWVEGGRIARVVNVVEWDEFRRQVGR
jgi:predicted ester cyclase